MNSFLFEGLDAVSAARLNLILSLIPPILAIGMAFLTRRVIPSLLLGIVIAGFIATGFEPVPALQKVGQTFYDSLDLSHVFEDKPFLESWNLLVFLFTATLGVIIAFVNRAGGAAAYGEWATKRVQTKTGASLSTMLLGVLIFFDDYFNSLTVGTIMKPITDRYKMSRAKLAYLIDSTAAPVVILAPVSSWVAEVISQIRTAGVGDTVEGNPFTVFTQSVMFNSYAWLTLVMVYLVCAGRVEFGPMMNFEKRAEETGELGQIETDISDQSSLVKNPSLLDLILPLGVMMIAVVGFMLHTGGFHFFGLGSGTSTFVEAFKNMNSALSLFWGGTIAFAWTMVMFQIRGVVPLSEYFKLILQGLNLMRPALTILVLAWTIGSLIKNDLQTGTHLASLLSENFPVEVLPAILFLMACFVSFSTGTSWGTFGIMIPIAVPLAVHLDMMFLVPMVAAILAGSIFGDHASPISDTTILSSTGAGCHHMDHVKTQLPYASLVGVICFFGFLLTGFTVHMGLTLSAFMQFGFGLVMLLVITRILNGRSSGRAQGAQS